MFNEQLAVISDVHGNCWALEAVLADIDLRGIRHIVNLGDCVYGPLEPAQTAKILMERGLPTVRGNEDRIIVDARHDAGDSPTLWYVRERLALAQLQWLKSLPLTATAFGDFLLCHGSLERGDEYLLRCVSEAGVLPRSAEELVRATCSVAQPVLLCGHDHTPCTVRLPDGRLIVNPGSVGLQAYTDDAPQPHAIETGSPHARYSIIAPGNADWYIETIALEYDWTAAAATAERNGRADWAVWLRTGRAKPA